MKVNYKSDFDFILTIKDCQGNDIGFPKFDWEAKFYSSQTKIIVYTVSFKDGVFTNCFNDEGKIHCVFDNHRLSAGELCMEFKAYTPNVIYPDKTKDIYTPMSTGIELVCGAGDCGSTASVEVVASFVYLTAYELAVKNGYEGTLEEYTEYVNKFPQVVETSEAMANMVSDWEKGKEKIAEALTKQGKPTSVAEPMEDMAQKVLDLHLAVEGDPQFVSHLQKLGKWDLFNEMYNHQRAEFPYMYAISFGINKVTLADADAYYCSDGFYTTEGGEYTFNTIGVKYVIFYFRDEDYVLKTQIAKTMYDICIVGGRPMMQVLTKKINTINVYGYNHVVHTVDTPRLESLTIQNIP